MASTISDPVEPFAHLVDPDYFATHGYPHDGWRELRAERPVHYVERARGDSFWAVTRHEDITTVGRQPELFSSKQIIVREPRMLEERAPEVPETLLQLDPPIHAKYRRLISKRMTPRRIAKLGADIERIAVDILKDLEEHEAAGCDFVDKVAAPLPIAVIAYLLGVPMHDWRQLYRWTNETAGASDPENRREGETAGDTIKRSYEELFEYFARLREKRLADPQDDLVTLLANATVDGEPIPIIDLLSFYHLLVSAGNETTRNATAGGLLALIEYPDEMAKLQADPSLVKSGVEEILRWTSPIIHFGRNATRDTELAGQTIRRGEVLALFYPSANRDESVFEEPYRFRVDRKPNRHLAFGVGEHYCLGAHVARLELQVIFRHLFPRLAEVELAGPVARLRSHLVGGVKRLPIRYKLKRA